jgi:hypothetical protein
MLKFHNVMGVLILLYSNGSWTVRTDHTQIQAADMKFLRQNRIRNEDIRTEFDIF